MNRRGFLQFIGVFAASAAIPKILLDERIALLPDTFKNLSRVLYRTPTPLAAGGYTFTANAGELGMYVGGVKALGGEMLIEVLGDKHMPDARLILGGITYPCRYYGGPFSMTAEEMLAHENRMRGIPVTRA